jgi:hypothetical protein
LQVKGRFKGRWVSALKLAALFGIAGGGAALFLGASPRIPLRLAAFFLVVAGFEFLATPKTRRRPPPPGVAPASSELIMIAAGEFGEYPYRGGERSCFGTVLPVAGRNIYIDLRKDDLLEARIQVARDLATRTAELARDFEAFKRAEAAGQPEWAEQILGLEMEMITFHHKDKPDAGEVYFTLESGQDRWFCTFLGGRFTDLAQES